MSKDAPGDAGAVGLRPIKALVPYARNARTHSKEQVEQIARSLVEFGWTNPVLIGEDDGIVAGHGRVLGAASIYKKGGTIRLASGGDIPKGQVPVIVTRGWSDAQKRAYVLADNKLALNAGWDEGLLKTEIGQLMADEFDIGLTGFSAEDLGGFGLGDISAPGQEEVPESNYSEQYGVIAICKDEPDQSRVYEALKAQGFTVKVVTT